MLVRACNLALHAKAARDRAVPSFGRTQVDKITGARKAEANFEPSRQVPPVTMEVKESTWARYRTRVQLQGGVSHLSQWEPP